MAGTAPLTGIQACVFDAYGTLFDFASAAMRCSDVLGDNVKALTPLWRDKQLQYTWLRAAQNRHADFWQVTGEALDFALETLGIADGQGVLRKRLMDCYLTLDAFPEAPAMLQKIKAAGFATAILSNGTPAMVAAAVEYAGLGAMLDHVLTVEAVGVFKPAPAVYQLAVDRLGVAKSAIAFMSSNAWDVHAASAFGLHTVWCNRTRQPRERLPGAPDREIATLAALPALLGV
ncbi:MAG TPA: haloacid dehalogenase type II [Stellaceae bacterium]|jgi:2-haloacid dehalogenase|nr:haloacid dehalogenase type II [Stellaceae bacterium]